VAAGRPGASVRPAGQRPREAANPGDPDNPGSAGRNPGIEVAPGGLRPLTLTHPVRHLLSSIWRFLIGRGGVETPADPTVSVAPPVLTPEAASAVEPEPAAGPTPESVGALLESLDVIDDLDSALGAAFDPSRPPAPIPEPAQDSHHGQGDRAAQELFASIAANYSRPVKDFIFELKRGTATKEWIEICQPVMGSIIDGAESLELHDVAQRMIEFRDALALAQASDGHVLDDDCRDFILSCYEELIGVLPETFSLDEQDQRRESIIIHSLLRQVPGVGHVTLEKLYGAGLTSLDALFLANESDLSAVSGVPMALCQRICIKVGEHRDRLRGASPEGAKIDRHGRLAELVRDLQQHHHRFQEIAAEEDPELAGEKREALRQRHACVLQINLLLAEMGEVDLVERTKRLGLDRRIEQLARFLSTASATAERHAAAAAHSLTTHP